MSEYKVYRHPIYGYEAIKNGFSWPAFFFTIFWMFFKRLWVGGVALFISMIVVVLGVSALPSLENWVIPYFLVNHWLFEYSFMSLIEAIASIRWDDAVSIIAYFFVLFTLLFWAPIFSGIYGNRWRENLTVDRGFEFVRVVVAAHPHGAIAVADKPAMVNMKLDQSRRLAVFTNSAEWLLYVTIGVSVAAFVINASEYELFVKMADQGFSSQEKAIVTVEKSDVRQYFIGALKLIVVFLSSFAVLTWLYLANKNARSLVKDKLVFTPWRSIAWYFLPIVNLWKPYQAMVELWKASRNPNAWHAEMVPVLLPAWWFSFVVAITLNIIGGYLRLSAVTTNEFYFLNVFSFIAITSLIVLCIFFLIIINKISEAQISQNRLLL